MAKIKIEYHHFDGEGPTVKEAKLDAGRKLDRFVRDMAHGPDFETSRNDNYTIAVYRCNYSETWSYRVFSNHLGGCECTGSPTREDAMRKAKYHLAQAESEIDAVRTDLCCPQDQQTLIEYFQWQKRWKEFKAQGFNDGACHKLASGWTVAQLDKADQGTMVVQGRECFCPQIGNGLIDACPLHQGTMTEVQP